MLNLRFAFRTLFKAPFVTTIAIVSLAFGIGANTAIFSLFNQMLVQALPVAEPERLVNLANPGPKPGSTSCGLAGGCDTVFSYAMFRDLQTDTKVFSDLAAHVIFGTNLAYKGQTLSGEGVEVSGSYFPALGLKPALGRLLGPGDDQRVGESLVVVLSHDYWTARFGASPAVLNDTLVVNGHHLTIVGVAPKGFTGTSLGAQPEVFVPITLRDLMQPGYANFANRRAYWAYLFGRLAPGVPLEEARTAMNLKYSTIINQVEAPLQKGMSEQTLARFKSKPLVLEPGLRGQSEVHHEASAPLTILFAVTGVVLLIACANIANLLLARSASRSGEMAVRLSIGASRKQLIGQLLLESCLLAGLGGLAGLLVAQWTLALIGQILPAEQATLVTFQLDATVLLFAMAVSIGTGLLFGVFPAIHSTRPDLASTLKGTAGQPSGGRAAKFFRSSLVVAQMALSLALLACAGLFTKSLYNISRVDLGLEIDHLVTFAISPELNGYKSDRSKAIFEQVEEALAALPGVTSVTASMVPLLGGSNWGTNVTVEGFKIGPDTDAHANFNEIGAGFFKTLGIPLMAGREFERADRAGAPKVAIVNEAFANKFGLGRDAVGKRMLRGGGSNPVLDTEIIGLAKDAKYSEVKETIPPLFFTPYRQDPRVGFATFYVRTAVEPEQFLKSIPALVSKIDRDLPIENLRTMPQQVRENVFLDRFISTMSAAFAALATLLAAVGLYGVLAYTVSQRTREFGLRMALGANAANVRGLVMRYVMILMVFGGVLGLGLAVWIGAKAESQLFEMKGRDPVVLAAAFAALALVALVAGLVPAFRASRLDPMRALRYE